MARILISWIARKNDFNLNLVNQEGPTFSFHRYFFKGFDKHLLLSSDFEEDEYSKDKLFFSELTKEFRQNDIQLCYMNLRDNDIVDFNRIHAVIFPLLKEFSQDEIDIFISPGTPTMQVVWYIVHVGGHFKTKLLQTLKPIDSNTGKDQLIEIQLSPSEHAKYFVMREAIEKKAKKFQAEETYYVTDSLMPVYNLASEVALTDDTTVLILGETGTGKEHLAKKVHNDSVRKSQPFIAVNCAAISSDLLESRLFGHMKGAFTGALETSDGYFQVANNGTIFLDEIGDINPHMQVALLRVIEEKEIQKVGSTKSEKVNVRIITATNKDLYKECNKGNFRWDLYYRLCVAELYLPPLKERGAKDIKNLLHYFNHKFYKYYREKGTPLKFTPEAMKLLLAHTWPGNVRELRNLVERFYAFGKQVIVPEDIPASLLDSNKPNSMKLDEVIRQHIQKVVALYKGNLTQAKTALDLGSVNTIKKYLNEKP